MARIRDFDAVCTSCRWKGAHAPDCELRDQMWPMIEVDTPIDWKARAERAELGKLRECGPEGGKWPDECIAEIDALEDKWDIDLCSTEFAAKFDRLYVKEAAAREAAEAALTIAQAKLDAVAAYVTELASIGDVWTDTAATRIRKLLEQDHG